jgi:RNA polymerase sigma factor (TIGR02999 family)
VLPESGFTFVGPLPEISVERGVLWLPGTQRSAAPLLFTKTKSVVEKAHATNSFGALPSRTPALSPLEAAQGGPPHFAHKRLLFLTFRTKHANVPRQIFGMMTTVGSSSNSVTDLLFQWSGGDSAARDKLVPLVYEELRRIARRCLAGQQPNHTLQSTALVHEAYLRLVGNSSVQWNDRVHFFAVAAQLMRHILVDHARRKHTQKRGGASVTLLLDESVASPKQQELDVMVLDDALRGLAAIDERQCRLVELRYFAGLSIDETSRALEISPATVKREWATARLWLLREMSRSIQA